MTDTYRVTIEPLGKEITCRSDQSVLDACLRAGVWLPHSCTHGTCATCKADVLDGDIDHGDASPFALMDFEKSEGKALLCVACPRSDLTIEADVDVDEDLPVHPVEDFTGTVVRLEDIATDIRRVVVELDRDLAFNAGQYMRFEIPGAPGVDRTYSMANVPTEPRRLEFHIRRTPGGICSDGWVFGGLSTGETVRLSGPFGRFVLQTGRSEPAVLIAGGTGLAPIMSMIRHALENDASDNHLTLYQGARSRDFLYDVDVFRRLADQHPDRFSYRPCLSDESAEGYASGLVTDVLAADHETLKGRTAYVCGPPPMVDAAMRVLMAKRLFPRDIYREDFFDASDKASGGLKSPLIKR